MFKFVKGYMESIENVSTYPMISLLIFFVFFMILGWWVYTASNDHIKEVSELPLEENDHNNIDL